MSRVSIPTGKGAGCKSVVNTTWGVRFPPHPCGWSSGSRARGCEPRGRWVQIPPVTCFMVVVQWKNDGLQNRKSGFDSLLPCAERFNTPSVTLRI